MQSGTNSNCRHAYRIVLALLCVLFLPAVVFAQKFTAVSSMKEVPLNFTFDVTYKVENGKLEKFTPPKFEGFDAYGPSQSQNISVINGQMYRSASYTYTLQPKRQGDFVIPSAMAVVEGKTLQSNTITIKVTAPQKQPSASASQGGGAQDPDPFAQRPQRKRSNSESDIQSEIARNLFVVVTPSRRTLYEGDQVTLSYKLYFRIQYQGLNVMKAPAYNGFLSEDFKTDPEQEPDIEVYNGRKYYTQEFKRIALFPQKAGKYTIDPMELSGTVFVEVPDPFFNDPFFATLEPYQYAFRSNAVDLEVLPLPSPQPPGFSGAVGTFSFSAGYDKDRVKVNEPVVLKVTFTGTGNLKLIQAPKLEFPEAFDAYPPKITESLASSGNTAGGSRSFEYTLVPQEGGKFTLPAYAFAYFDPEKKKYGTFSLPATTIDVEGQAAPSANLLRVLKRDRKAAAKQEIYPIAEKPVSADRFFASPLFWSLSGAPIFLLLLGFLTRRRSYDESELLLLRRRKANRMALKRLAKARSLMREETEQAFYDEVIRALWQYTSDKLHISASELSKENIGLKLTERAVAPEQIARLIVVLDTCEQSLFSPEGKATRMKETFTEAVDWISQTDEQLSRQTKP